MKTMNRTAAAVPKGLGEGRYVLVIGDSSLMSNKVNAFWTEDANNAYAFKGGNGRALAVIFDIDERNELDRDSIRLANADNAGGTVFGLDARAVKIADRIVGIVTQTEYDQESEVSRLKAMMRFDLKINSLQRLNRVMSDLSAALERSAATGAGCIVVVEATDGATRARTRRRPRRASS